MSYLWHTVSAFMGSVHGLATEMFFKLVQHRSQGSGSWKGHGGQGAGHNDGSDFLLLLKHLVLQLSSCEGNARPWLASCLADSSTSAQLSSSLRLAMGLPAHLLFCNSIHEMVRDHHGQHFLSNLRCFSKSNLNTGGCLSLDATVFVLQGFSCMTERFEPELCEMLLSDPMVTTSVLVHKATLESVNLLRNLPMDWMDQCLQAFVWAQRTVTGENVPECCEKVSPYMKAAAVFALCPDRRSDEKLVPNLQALDPQVLDFVLELTMCRITWNVDSCSLQDTADMTLVAGLLSLRPESLCSLLTHGAHEWTTRVRHSLGLACSGQHRRLRDYLLLRTLEKLALTDLCRRGSQVPSCVLSAYCQLLGHYFEDTDFVSQVVSDDLLTLAKLMSGLVEVSSGEHLRQMDLTLLRHTDPVLYRKVLHKR
ncbi:uncharacterized protein LOC101848095 [Aplysia californica]|uniref:Uncharacterized protein LOC101848095 n=1 Tax=Aplysia californica TaxID=6500 RepID=A0ABM1AET8_APLCA|nr:uncharacterized protein LOC101848095 [Aplysia californica]